MKERITVNKGEGAKDVVLPTKEEEEEKEENLP